MSVELDHTLSSHHADSSSSVLSKASSLPEGTMSKHSLSLCPGCHIASSAVAVNSHLGYVLFWRRCRKVLLEFPSVPQLSASLHLDVIRSWSRYSRIHFHVKMTLRPSSFDRFTSTPLFSGGFLRTDLHSSKPCFVPTRCSSDDACPHQQCDDSNQILVNLDNKSSKWNDR